MNAASPFVGSLAIVRRGRDRAAEWLALLDEARNTYRFVEARRRSHESFRSCLIGAIEDTLGLSDRDYLLSGYSLAHYQAPVEWDDQTPPAWAVVEFFPVELYGTAARSRLDQLEHARWWTMQEVASGATSYGLRLCERQHLLIQRADILPAWARG